MRAIVDTHVALWWLADDPRLGGRHREILADPDHQICWSAASSFELSIKLALGKVELPEPAAEFFRKLLGEDGFEWLPIENRHCARLAELPVHHRDPFDRMLVAQAQEEDVPLLSADPKLAGYDVVIL